MKQLILAAGLAGALCFHAERARAQGGPPGFGGPGGFDPAAMQKMMLDAYREQLEVKDDAEWKLIQERVQKVMDARRQIGFGGGGGAMMARMFRRNQGGDGAPPPDRPRFGPQPSPEEESLQKAIDNKASSAELKAALAKLVEARKQKQASLEKSQEDLRQLLSARQEAIATVSGLL